MLKSGLALAAAAFLVSPYGPALLVRSDDTTGRWEAELRDGADRCGLKDDGLCLQLTLRLGSRLNRSTWGFPVSVDDFSGLAARADDYSAPEVHFELRRDAGIVTFEGRFDEGDGRGDFSFVPNQEYRASLRKAGYGSAEDTELLALAVHNVSTERMTELAGRGYAKGGLDDLIAFSIHGVDPEFIDEMSSQGEHLDADELVALRIHGVDGSFKQALAELDLDDEDDLVSLKIQGVDADYIRGLKDAGLEDLDVDQMVSAKIQGISPQWVRDMVESGLEDLDLDDLISAKIQGVDGRFVWAMRDAGLKDADLDDLVGLKIQGVSPAFARKYLEEEPDADADDVVSSWLHRRSR